MAPRLHNKDYYRQVYEDLLDASRSSADKEIACGQVKVELSKIKDQLIKKDYAGVREPK